MNDFERKQQEAEELYNELQLINSEENNQSNEDESGYYISRQQKGWWSSGEIIKSLSDRKIKQAIEGYRQIISLLENELVSRSVHPIRKFGEGERLSVYETGSTIGRYVQHIRTSRRQAMGRIKELRPRLRSIQKAQGKFVAKLLEDTWCKILEAYFEEEGANK